MARRASYRAAFAPYLVWLALTASCSRQENTEAPDEGAAREAGIAPEAGRTPATSPPLADAPIPDAAHPYTRCEDSVGTGDAPLIDDFEDGDWQILQRDGRDGPWFSYDDGTGGAQRVQFESQDGSGTLHATSQGFSRWGSAVGARLGTTVPGPVHCAYDAAAYRGLRFRAKGSGRMRVRLATVGHIPEVEGGRCALSGESCYDWPGAWISLSADWQSHELPFCSLVPEGWGRAERDFDLRELAALHFRFDIGSDFELWLDDVEFISDDDASSETGCEIPCPLEAAPAGSWDAPGESYLPLGEQLSVHTFEQSTPNCGPLTRRYLSSVPAELGPSSDAPVVFALHGSSANAESQADAITRGSLDALARERGFIVVYGNAAPGPSTSDDPFFPNTGSWRQATFDDGQVDDGQYLWLVLDDLRARGVISGDNPVYLSGLSNGGGMVLEAARRYPDRVTGVAAFMPFDGLEPAAIPDLQSSLLERVLLVYSMADPGLPDGYELVLDAQPARWATSLGLPSDTGTTTALANHVNEGEGYDGSSELALATTNSRGEQIDYVNNDVRGRLRVLRFDHAGHFLPHPDEDSEVWILERWGFRNQDLDASIAMWEFFSAP